MTFEHGKFFGGWYFAVFHFERFVGVLAGPFKTIEEATKLAPQMACVTKRYKLPDDENTSYGPVFLFRSTLLIGTANDEVWGLPEINEEPVDVLALDVPALYAVRDPTPAKKGGGWL